MPAQSSTEESQLNVQGYNIVTILKRLEAATSRLEDITIFQEEASKGKRRPLANPSETGTIAAALVNGSAIPSPEQRETAVGNAAPSGSSSLSLAVHCRKYWSVRLPPRSRLTVLWAMQLKFFRDAFAEQAKFLALVAQTKNRIHLIHQIMECLGPINKKIERTHCAQRTPIVVSDFFNHLNTVAEGAPVLGWVVTDTPTSFIPGV